MHLFIFQFNYILSRPKQETQSLPAWLRRVICLDYVSVQTMQPVILSPRQLALSRLLGRRGQLRNTSIGLEKVSLRSDLLTY